MNNEELDAIRSEQGVLGVDLIDAYAENRISRRDFVRRGTILGVGAPVLGAVIAACGGDTAETGTAAEDSGSDGSGEEEAVEDEEEAMEDEEEAAPAAAGGAITVGILQGDALDPVNMLDLGTYAVCSSSFEYLVGLADDGSGNIGTLGLAESWAPNDDGTAWTFNLRSGVQWHSGGDLTAADVVATIERMIEVGAGLAGVVSPGGAVADDDLTVTVNLDGPNGNFPVLVSIYNPQSLITPADYTQGTTLDARPDGTGPWLFESFDPTTYTVTFTANDNYWSGRPILDNLTLQGFDDAANSVAAMAAGEINIIQEFSAIDGAALLADDSFTTLQPPSANHRQVYFNTQLPEGGPFTNNLVRQALGYTLDRQQIVDVVFGGFAIIGNDHPVHPTLPFFDSAAVPQRTRDIPAAQALLAEAGFPDGIDATIQAGQISFSPDLAAIIQENAAEAGFNLTVNVTDNGTFYGEFWCTGASYGVDPDSSGPGIPCGASSPVGIVDWGHRPTPDIFFGRALQTDGDWNGSNYNSDAFNELFTQYQSAVNVEEQTAAASAIMAQLHEDTPALYPAFFDYLGGHNDSVSNVEMTALGHLLLLNTSLNA